MLTIQETAGKQPAATAEEHTATPEQCLGSIWQTSLPHSMRKQHCNLHAAPIYDKLRWAAAMARPGQAESLLLQPSSTGRQHSLLKLPGTLYE
jgi:hypothetical protein